MILHHFSGFFQEVFLPNKIILAACIHDRQFYLPAWWGGEEEDHGVGHSPIRVVVAEGVCLQRK